MAILINAYCTHRNPPSLDFAHTLMGRRDRTDPELPKHLSGFTGYVLSKGGSEMTTTLYHVMRHVQRVQHHLSLEINEGALDSFARWAWEANAICFLPDGTVRDPAGRVLVYPTGAEPDDGAEVPFPRKAHERKARSDSHLKNLGILVPDSLPPVISEPELDLRPAAEVAMRAIALFTVALRAESLAQEDDIPITDLRARLPLAFESLSPKENEFLNTESPEQQELVNFGWRYEALYTLLWALGVADALPLPTEICDVSWVASAIVDRDHDQFVKSASLRPASELLDALDLHYRFHWAARQAQIDNKEPPGNLNAGVISERHYALNWLTRFEDADWDNVDTPT